MGKAGRWFRALLGSKKSSPGSPKAAKKSNARNSGGVSRGTHAHGSGGDASAPKSHPSDANKHAIAVAAATAAVAEAALAAAQAAAEVVRLTSGNRPAAAYVSSSSDRRREWAAVKIQSEFRAYLARRALRALKGLVKLQALVRGRIVRKQSAEMLRRMQAMARIQARACKNRSDASHPHINNTTKSHRRGSSSLSKFDYLQQQQQHSSSTIHGSNLKRCYSKPNKAENMSTGRMDLGSKWLDHWMEEYARNNSHLLNMGRGYDDGEKSDKILEIDNGQGSRAYYNSMSSSSNLKKPNPASLSSGEVSTSSQSVKFPREVNQEGKWTVDQSPSAGFHSSSKHGGSSRSRRGGRGPFTPNRSECTRSLGFSDFPNYMANTQSFSAKVRSHSAPRQRMQQKLVTGRCDTDTVSEKSWSIHGNFRGKGYAGSGRMVVMQTHLSS